MKEQKKDLKKVKDLIQMLDVTEEKDQLAMAISVCWYK